MAELRGDLGPVDLAAFARLAASFFSDSGIRLHYAGRETGWMRMLLDLLWKIDVTEKDGHRYTQMHTDKTL
jgi:hypothetical protein